MKTHSGLKLYAPPYTNIRLNNKMYKDACKVSAFTLTSFEYNTRYTTPQRTSADLHTVNLKSNKSCQYFNFAVQRMKNKFTLDTMSVPFCSCFMHDSVRSLT